MSNGSMAKLSALSFLDEVSGGGEFHNLVHHIPGHLSGVWRMAAGLSCGDRNKNWKGSEADERMNGTRKERVGGDRLGAIVVTSRDRQTPTPLLRKTSYPGHQEQRSRQQRRRDHDDNAGGETVC